MKHLLEHSDEDAGIDIQSLVANSRFTDRSDLLTDEFIISRECKLNVMPPLH